MSREQAHAVSFQPSGPQPDIHRLTKEQKRLEQNRKSQRSFRDRQAKLVEDLRGKIEVLEDENGKLREELKKYKEESHVK
jgi:cell shape-determining protein MreC